MFPHVASSSSEEFTHSPFYQAPVNPCPPAPASSYYLNQTLPNPCSSAPASPYYLDGALSNPYLSAPAPSYYLNQALPNPCSPAPASSYYLDGALSNPYLSAPAPSYYLDQALPNACPPAPASSHYLHQDPANPNPRAATPPTSYPLPLESSLHVDYAPHDHYSLATAPSYASYYVHQAPNNPYSLAPESPLGVGRAPSHPFPSTPAPSASVPTHALQDSTEVSVPQNEETPQPQRFKGEKQELQNVRSDPAYAGKKPVQIYFDLIAKHQEADNEQMEDAIRAAIRRSGYQGRKPAILKSSPPVPRDHDAYGKCQDFLNYLKENWMCGPFKNLWCKWGLSELRTTNLAEAFHRRIQVLASVDHPPLSVLIDVLKKLNYEARAALTCLKEVRILKAC
ncbi:hypothetical protein TELCIR_22715 [Teladorsagia circumcincta]|uniref:Uncharacterized protein n=1 Tax=Teladorsagia circumcincta TaxID=45464 RepID=A0A2G9TD57_TELCI|nr:hypothetical protein TELCIR_22715 [Teladorsagia circumcincta]